MNELNLKIDEKNSKINKEMVQSTRLALKTEGQQIVLAIRNDGNSSRVVIIQRSFISFS